MTQPFVIIAGVVLLTLLGFIIWRIRQQHEWGFMDLIKHPELWEELLAGPSKTDRKIIEAKSWSADRISAELDNYLFKSKSRRESWPIAMALEKLGPRVHSHVLRILADKSRHKELATPTHLGDNNSLPETPFERACQILDSNPPFEALAPLIPFQDDENKQIRKHAILTMASVGTPETIPLIRKALADQDNFVRSYALMGLGRALKNNCLSAMCRQELFNDLEPLVDGEHYAINAAKLLFEFDAARAETAFLSDAAFTASPARLKEILNVLANRGIEVPRNRLAKIIEETDAPALKYPENYKLAGALRLLGAHKNTSDLTCLEKFLSYPDKVVAEGAAEGLLTYHSLTGFSNLILKRRESDPASLTVPQVSWLSVQELDGEINNGGLAQYFLNPTGDDWKHAFSGLKIIGMSEREAIMKEAIERFGPEKPSENHKRRREQLAKLARNTDDPFHDLDDRYYASKEVVEVALTKYVIQNATAFQ